MKELYIFLFVIIQCGLTIGLHLSLIRWKGLSFGWGLSILIGLSFPISTFLVGFLTSEFIYRNPGFGMLLAIIGMASLIALPFTVATSVILKTRLGRPRS
jgi:hypothetical protein